MNSKPASIPALAASTLGLWSRLTYISTPILGAVVVDHRANVGQADHRDLVVADLYQDGCLLGLGGADDRQQRLLVVDVEGADCEVLTTGATHQLPGSLDVRSGRRRHRSILSQSGDGASIGSAPRQACRPGSVRAPLAQPVIRLLRCLTETAGHVLGGRDELICHESAPDVGTELRRVMPPSAIRGCITSRQAKGR